MTTTEPDLAKQVRSGAAWGTAGIAISRLLQFATTVVLARIVAPEDFGLLAVAMAVQIIALNASELGATAAIGRATRDPDAIAPTVYTIALVTSGLLTALMALGAPALAQLFGSPDAEPVIRVLSATILLAGISSVPTALIWRNFHQRRRLAVDITSIVVTAVLLFPMALAGWGAMAMAWSRLGGAVVGTVLYLFAAPRRYRPGFNRREAKGILSLGAPLAVANIVVFATLNVDYLIVGRQLGAATLGVYLLAFNLASLPSGVLTQMLRTVAVPAFGRLHARGRLGAAVPPAVRVMTLPSFLVSALLVMLAHPLMTVLYGTAYSGGGATLAWLAVFGAARVVTEVLADIAVGAGWTQSLMWIQVAWLVLLVPAMLAGVQLWGVAGAGVAHAAVTWLAVVPLFGWVVSRATGCSVSNAARGALPALGAALVCGGAGALAAHAVASPWVSILLGGLTGSAAFVGVAWRPALRTAVEFGIWRPRERRPSNGPLGEVRAP